MTEKGGVMGQRESLMHRIVQFLVLHLVKENESWRHFPTLDTPESSVRADLASRETVHRAVLEADKRLDSRSQANEPLESKAS